MATYGEDVTRLCQLRDEMKKTPEGRAALEQVKWALGCMLTFQVTWSVAQDWGRRYYGLEK